MKSKSILIIALGIAALPAAAIVANQSRNIETIAAETLEQPAAQVFQQQMRRLRFKIP